MQPKTPSLVSILLQVLCVLLWQPQGIRASFRLGHVQQERDVSSSSVSCGQQLLGDVDDKIIGGEVIQPDEFPWQVGLEFMDFYLCGGTLISSQWVLTAAHCLKLLETVTWMEEYTVALHAADIGEATPAQKVPFAEIFIHPDYDENLKVNDIALIKLSKPIDFEATQTRPICLPGAKDNFTDVVCTITGYGTTNENQTSEDLDLLLRKTDVLVHSREDCLTHGNLNTMFFRDTNLCAGYPEGGKDACHGDSGGPLSCPSQGQGQRSWTLAGVTASGYGCGRPGNYGIYTKVQAYLPWIYGHVTPEAVVG